MGSQVPRAPPAQQRPVAAQTPEEVVLRLQAMQATVDANSGEPPPEVVGVALHVAGVPTTRENVVRGLQQASGRVPNSEEIQAALVAVANEIASPGAFRDAAPTGSAGVVPQQAPETPEEVAQVLLRAAGVQGAAAAPPAEVIGMAMRAAGVEVSKENVMRAFSEVGR